MRRHLSYQEHRRTSQVVAAPERLEPRRLLSEWSVGDSFQLAIGQTAKAQALAVDLGGNVYAAGSAWDSSGHSHALVREKPAGSSSWTTIEDYTVPSPGAAHGGAWFYAIACDNAGDVYVAGQTTDSAGKLQWIVQEKLAGSSGFATVDSSTTGGMAEALAVDSAGNVFAAGQTVIVTAAKGNKTTSQNCWTVRKQVGGMGAFITVDSVTSSSGSSANAWGATSIGSGTAQGLYVVGTGPANNWLVRKSSDGGASWTAVDSFLYDPSVSSSQAYGVAGDSAGNVYVVGRGGSSSVSHWLARESGDGGASWSTVDDFLPGNYGNAAYAVGTDLGGSVYVAGEGRDANGIWHEMVRTNAGGSWSTVNDLNSSTSGGSQGLAVDPTGNLYLANKIGDASGIGHWTIQTATTSSPISSASFSSTAIATSSAVSSADSILDRNASPRGKWSVTSLVDAAEG